MSTEKPQSSRRPRSTLHTCATSLALQEACEHAADGHTLIDVSPFVPAADEPLFHATLCELVKIDLDWRHRHTARLEDYLARFPELGPADARPPTSSTRSTASGRRFGDGPLVGDLPASGSPDNLLSSSGWRALTFRRAPRQWPYRPPSWLCHGGRYGHCRGTRRNVRARQPEELSKLSEPLAVFFDERPVAEAAADAVLLVDEVGGQGVGRPQFGKRAR